jgi:hypothetical protein
MGAIAVDHCGEILWICPQNARRRCNSVASSWGCYSAISLSQNDLRTAVLFWPPVISYTASSENSEQQQPEHFMV